jgi:hypothetical protein
MKFSGATNPVSAYTLADEPLAASTIASCSSIGTLWQTNEDMIAALDRGDALKKVLRRPRDVRIKPGLLQDRFARLKQQVVTAICEDAAPVD